MNIYNYAFDINHIYFYFILISSVCFRIYIPFGILKTLIVTGWITKISSYMWDILPSYAIFYLR